MSQGTRPQIPSKAELQVLPPDGGPHWNRLVFESSPYLLQHAANPVDWYPWGEDAFAAARERDVPLFLSIGYATCHWCHVMEHQCFEDEEVAALMNHHFVCIKVDKEERPDIDDIYMSACLAMNGHGGWPLTILLTHDKEAFLTGTYFPKHGHYGRPGLMGLIPRIARAWEEQRDQLKSDARELTVFMQEMNAHQPGERLDQEIIARAAEQLELRFDPEHGGFGRAPKFPSPHNYSLLLRHWKRTGQAQSLEIVSKSLRAMRLGGVFDQLGFGFHRYSTDREWLLPHFEKMLYDQAMLAIAYLETWQATGDDFFKQVAEEIFIYVLRDMTAPEGGFYSAEDADSEGIEGKFYVWRPEEVIQILGEEDGGFFNQTYQIHQGGNFVDEATHESTGDNIPHLTAPLSVEDAARLKPLAEKLFQHREARIHPLKDDKILTDWNGLMITALALGGRVLNNERYTQAASKAADFVLTTLATPEGRLLKRYRNGEAGLTAHLDDYAFTIMGLLELYRTTLQPTRLQAAVELTETVMARFQDPESGALFLTPDDGEALIVRGRKVDDGAIPSGNSIMAGNLARLGKITGQTRFVDAAEEVIKAFASPVGRTPIMASQLLCALDFLLGPVREVVIAGKSGDPVTKAMIAALDERFDPHLVAVLRAEDDAEAVNQLTSLIPSASERTMINGATTAYVCRDFSCQMPAQDLETLRAQLES